MMLHKLVLFTLLIITLNSCKDAKNSPINAEQNKSIPGDYFENDSAGDLNDQGIEFSKNGNYKKAYEFGKSKAYLDLAKIYKDEYKNDKKAFEVIKECADNYNYDCITELGYFYQEGIAVKKDLSILLLSR